jgi:hypothetical protein
MGGMGGFAPGGMMRGTWGPTAPTTSPTGSADQAQQIAQQWLDQYQPGSATERQTASLVVDTLLGSDTHSASFIVFPANDEQESAGTDVFLDERHQHTCGPTVVDTTPTDPDTGTEAACSGSQPAQACSCLLGPSAPDQKTLQTPFDAVVSLISFSRVVPLVSSHFALDFAS